MKTTGLSRIGVVVYDLDATKAEYERLYGITSWVESECAPADTVSYGRRTRRTPGTWRAAVGTTPVSGGPGPAGQEPYPVTFELIQPTGGESIFNEHLLRKGQGIAFIRVETDAASVADIACHLDQCGVEEAFSATIDGQERRFWDTRDKLGGFFVEMLTDAATASATTAATAAAGNGASASVPQPMQGIYHFGVLVHDVTAALPHYRDIFGIESFDIKTWESGFGRLDAPQYRGDTSPVGYFTAQGLAGNFGFEVIEMKYGSCHYNREFFDDRGPGIHHFFGWMTTEDSEWNAVVDNMTAAGHPMIMSSPLRGGAAEFGYFDTFDALGGYLIEIVIRRFTAQPEFMAPDWVIDYTEEA